MGLKNKTNLKSAANIIRSAKVDGENTAERIGKMFSDIIDSTDETMTEESAKSQQSLTNLQATMLGVNDKVQGNTDKIAELTQLVNDDNKHIQRVEQDLCNCKETVGQLRKLMPERCSDEAELEAKAATAEVGQQFYIPE